MLRHGDIIRAWRHYDRNSQLVSVCNINTIEANTGTADYLEIWTGIHNRGIALGNTYDKCIGGFKLIQIGVRICRIGNVKFHIVFFQ